MLKIKLELYSTMITPQTLVIKHSNWHVFISFMKISFCAAVSRRHKTKDILYTLKTGSSTMTVYEFIGLVWYKSTSRYVITVCPKFPCSPCTTHIDYSVIPKMKAILKCGESIS